MPSRFLHDVFAGSASAREIIPNIVDVERFRFRRREPLRPRILSTRNFEPLYNLPCTLRAFRLVQDRHPDAQLTLVGGGIRRKRALRQLAEELRLENVTLRGPVPPEDIWRVLRRRGHLPADADIDNMPASVLEAFASGCPVVATEAGGVPAILTDEHARAARPVRRPPGRRGAMLRLLDDPGSRPPGRRGTRQLRALPVVGGSGAWVDALSGLVRPRALRPATPA